MALVSIETLTEEELKQINPNQKVIQDLISLSSGTLGILLRQLGYEGDITYDKTDKLQQDLVQYCSNSNKVYRYWRDVYGDYVGVFNSNKASEDTLKNNQELGGKLVKLLNIANPVLSYSYLPKLVLNENIQIGYTQLLPMVIKDNKVTVKAELLEKMTNLKNKNQVIFMLSKVIYPGAAKLYYAKELKGKRLGLNLKQRQTQSDAFSEAVGLILLLDTNLNLTPDEKLNIKTKNINSKEVMPLIFF